MSESNVAQAAQCEDWDSDENSAIPGTRIQAQQQDERARQNHNQHHRHHQNHPTQQQQQQPTASSSANRPPTAPDAASDSGYSSFAAKSPVPVPINTSASGTAPQHALRSPTRTKSKPVIHRADSARSTQNTQRSVPTPTNYSNSSERQRRRCSDPNCHDPDCSTTSARDSEQRYAPSSQRPVSQHGQHPKAPQYQQMPSYQYAQMPPAQATAMMPPPPLPRPRTSQPRPLSIHGYSSLSHNAMSAGPPPSASAYYAYSQPYGQQPQAYVEPMSSAHMSSYAPPSPQIPSSPKSPSVTYPGFPGYSAPYSARQANPSVPGLEMPKQAPQPGLSRTISARQRPDERVRKQLRSPETSESDTGSSSESDSEASADEEYHRHRQDPRRLSYSREDTTALVHQSRRPSMNKKYYTENNVQTRARRESMPREALRRAPRSDTYVDYPSSSDVGDSDRTARAVIDRRSTFSSARSSRRPSVSTTASSGRTKATTLSSMTDGSRGQLVVEGRHGRQTTYLSAEDREKIVRHYQRQQLEEKLDAQRLREEKIASYQKNMSGGDPYELTAENMRRGSTRHSGSHVSGRSQKSSGSGSKASRSEGIQIKSGDTVLHVYGDAKIEMRPSEDGGPAQFVIASSNGRESEYRTSSKSSGSRMGRSRNRSDVSRRVIRETPQDY